MCSSVIWKEPDFDHGQQGNTAIARDADDSSTLTVIPVEEKKIESSCIRQKVSAPKLWQDSSVLKQHLYVIDREQLVWWEVRMQAHLKHLLQFGKET